MCHSCTLPNVHSYVLLRIRTSWNRKEELHLTFSSKFLIPPFPFPFMPSEYYSVSYWLYNWQLLNLLSLDPLFRQVLSCASFVFFLCMWDLVFRVITVNLKISYLTVVLIQVYVTFSRKFLKSGFVASNLMQKIVLANLTI